MATLRKYNEGQDKWEGIASNDASGIYSDNPGLTEDAGGNVVSVEDILLRYRAEISKLQRNVAWLAKHGGGGSGGSGGGGGVKATLSVLDPTDGDVSEITSLVWSNDITHLSYKLVSNSKTTFVITVKLNNNIIQTETITAKTHTGSISITGIKKYIGTGGTLNITAVDLSESEFSTNCRLIISSVILNDSSIRLTKDQLAAHEANPLRITCRTNVVGRYRLYYCNTMIYMDSDGVYTIDEYGNRKNLDGSGTEEGSYISLNIEDTNITNVTVDIVECGLLVTTADPGTYNRYFLLVSETNSLVRSSVAGSQIILIVTEGILVSPQTGSMDSPYTIALDSILPMQFTVYSSNTGTYSYSISIKGRQVGDTVSGAQFNTSITVPINMGNLKSFLTPGEECLVEITAFQGLIRETGTTKIKVLKETSALPSRYLEDINRHTIFDYTFYNIENNSQEYQYVNSHYYMRVSGRSDQTTTSSLSLKNIGIDSGTTSVFYKFRHTAYGEIITNGDFHWFASTTSDTSCYIPKSDFQFTLQVAYHIDEVEDDSATILNLGTYNPEDNTGHGILITSHKLYIALENTTLSEDLQDNDFTQLDIVSTLGNDGSSYWLRIYQNAKLLSTKQFSLDDKGTSGSQNLRKIFLGCKSVNNSGLTEDDVNLDLYSIKLFSSALNVGQIICSYINNYANYTRLDGRIQAELVTQMCENNQIATGTEETLIVDTDDISPIYDFKRGEYTWRIESIGNNITLPDSIKKLPIPVVTISVADAGWSFDDFTKGTYNSSPAVNCPFTYKSGVRNSDDCVPNLTVESSVTVSIQGTTSASYTIKNLNITFPEGTLFSPINTWFPENTFTLKADVVDSGHINNAVIGKFVNRCFYENPGDSLMNITGCFPTVSKVRELQSREQIPQTLKVKATIEGFPVLLVMNFKKGDSREVVILGIYSFNLGRESYYNHGYKVAKHLYPPESSVPYTTMSQIQFPALFGEPPIDDIDRSTPGYCYEGQASHNCSMTPVAFTEQQYDIAAINLLDYGIHYYPAIEITQDNKVKYGNKILVGSDGKEVPYNPTRVTKYKIEPNGYFWSTHESYTSGLWKFVADPSIVDITKSDSYFRSLNNCVATEIPYRKGTISQSYGSTVDQYMISTSGDTINTSKTGATFTLRAAQSDAEQVFLSVKNTAFYYVVAMLFGLVDSLGKNLQMKYWGKGIKGEYFWSPAFYDMDTALGLDNTGQVSIGPNVLDYSIFNTQEYKAQAMYGMLPTGQTDIPTYTVYSNKLWGIENPDFVRQYSQDFSVNGSDENSPNANFFAQMWHNLRTTMIKDPDEFFETYFAHQFDGCGEFLINYDYQVKYLNTSEQQLLHGNRLSYIKNWLEKRVTFLDSVFGFVQRAQNNVDYSLTNYLEVPGSQNVSDINAYNVPWKNQVVLKHNSGTLTLPIKTNRYVIMKITVGGVNTSYTYVPSNKLTPIIVAEGVGTMGIQTNINNSSCITDIDGLRELGLTEISPRPLITVYNSSGNAKYPDNDDGNLKNQWGSFASLKTLDLAGLRTFYTNIDFFRLFKTWDSSVWNGSLGSVEPNYFSLHTLDLSNMTTGANLSVNLNGESYPNVPIPYENPFINLSSLNINNSDVSNIVIPGNVSLSYLNILNSRISKLSLSKQPLLKSISFSGCKNLSELLLEDCQFTDLVFDNNNVSLNRIEVSNCSKLKTFRIIPDENNTYAHVPEITIQNCAELETIIITNLINTLNSDNRVLKIINCPKLKRLEITKSKFVTIIWDKDHPDEESELNLTSLLLNSSTVTTLKGLENDAPNNIIDLTGISSIANFSISNNASVEYIRFNNKESSPVNISKSYAFSSCTALKRVYGNITISNSDSFNNCTNFSVLGGFNYNGVDMILNEEDPGTRKVKHFYDPDVRNSVLGSDGRPKFLSGKDASNIKLIGSNSGSSAFRGTACTELDVYYILYNIGTGVLNINSIFYQCPNIRWTWINSPSRYTFKQCSNVTTASSSLRSNNSTAYRLYSPTVDGEGQYNDDGFFSGLTNCTNISAMFLGSGSYVIDRHLFRRKTGIYRLNDISYFYPRYIVDNVENYSSIESLATVFNDISTLRSDAENGESTGSWRYGDLRGFFINLTNLTIMNGIFNGTGFINYDVFNYDSDSKLRIPIGVKTLRLSFRSVYSYGTITHFYNIFETPNDVFPTQGIYSSFITTGSGLNATLEITDRLFDGFDRITGIGYYNDNSDFNSGERSFAGMRKIICQSTFPYNIVPNKENIVRFQGIFENASFKEEFTPSIILELPGIMFSGCNNLGSVSYLFYNFNNDYSLTSNSFEDCSNLYDVGYLFGCNADDTNRTRLNHLTGSIPNKLFYHGHKTGTISKTGLYSFDSRANVNTDSLGISITQILGDSAQGTKTEVTEEGHTIVHNYTFGGFIPHESQTSIYLVPTTNVTDKQTESYSVTTTDPITGEETESIVTSNRTIRYQFGSTIDLVDGDTIRIEYTIPNATIAYMSNCFRGANIQKYEHAEYLESEEENLSTYQPFDFLFVNNKWTNEIPNKAKKTLMWVYDGLIRRYLDYVGGSTDYDFLDDTVEQCQGDIYYPRIGDSEAVDQNTGYFCCAPDLLRYCTASPDVKGMFAYCGQVIGYPSRQYNQLFNLLGNDCVKYGLHGRIVPYLFKQTPRIDNLSYFFAGCKLLGWYSESGLNYTIPQSLFSYITTNTLNLSGMFYGCHFPKDISLDVFKGQSRSLNVSNIFRYACYDSTSSSWITVQGIFNDNRLTLTGLNSAFRISRSDVEGDSGDATALIRNVYVTFANNFKSGYFPVSDAKFVYDGYREGTVVFTEPKELPTDPDNRNYRVIR